jgi:methyl-galactoside transport system permease protein
LRERGANSAYGFSYEFDAISSCVVGGVSLSGGIGTVPGHHRRDHIHDHQHGLGVHPRQPELQLIIKGVIICSAVALDMRERTHE